jgi:hypothetical protein
VGKVLAGVTMVSLMLLPGAQAIAAGSAGLAELRAAQLETQAQVQALVSRLDRLEADNRSLRSANDALRAELRDATERRDAELEYLRAEAAGLREQDAATAGELQKLEGVDWAGRVRFKGDLRVRNENITTEHVVGDDATAQVEDAADRNRMRYRARLSAEARVTDSTRVVLGLASGEGDPRSTNQTFGDIGSGKGVVFDLAYADWSPAPGTRVLLGKHRQPFRRTGQSLFFDADINPEGVAVTYERAAFSAAAYGWWLQEGYDADPDGENEDANIFGLQLGTKFQLFGGESRLAAHYYDCGACRGNSPFWSGGDANGNTTVTGGSDAVQVLKYDYDVLVLSGEMDLELLGRPLAIWADWARNLASGVEYDLAYGVGAFLGRAAAARSWEAGVLYQSMDKDAMFAQLVDSDFAAGRTDGDGWLFRFGYAPVSNVVLNATWMLNRLYKDEAPVTGPGYSVGSGLDYQRLQLDVNYRF